MNEARARLAVGRVVHLVRHGEVENPGGVVYGCLPGFVLSDRGRAQADATAHHLARVIGPRAWLVVSPLERAQETAARVAAVLGGRVEGTTTDARLVEAGSPLQGLPRRFQPFAWARRLVGGSYRLAEPPGRIGARMLAALDDALACSGAEPILVSHQLPVRMAVAAIEARWGRSLALRHWPWLGVRLPCGLASVTTVTLGGTARRYWEP